jgi:hypothetical protein
VELQRRVADLRAQGLGLAVITYDPPEVLKRFAAERGITFPLLSDRGSAIIRRYGIFNTGVAEGTRAYGVPYPGTFVLDGKGVVVARYFEDAYQERNTVAAILAKQGGTGDGPSVVAQTAHLTVQAVASDRIVAPGSRISLALAVTPGRGMHVYAPGKHDYQVVTFTAAPQPWLKTHPLTYPPSEIYHFVPLDERVETYQRPFTLVQDLTILATPEVQKLLAGRTTLTIAGRLEYQACDDKVCYNPSAVPIAITLELTPLLRPPPPPGR